MGCRGDNMHHYGLLSMGCRGISSLAPGASSPPSSLSVVSGFAHIFLIALSQLVCGISPVPTGITILAEGLSCALRWVHGSG